MKIYLPTAAFLAVLLWLVYSVYYLNQPSIYAEHGILENLQALTLLVSFVIFFLPPLMQKRGDKIFSLFFALLCFAFILREVDVEDFNLPSIIVFWGAGTGRTIFLSIALFAFITYGLAHLKYYKPILKNFLKSQTLLLLFIAALLLQTGEFLEGLNSIPHHALWEEISELCGYVVMVCSAILLYKHTLIDRS